MDNGKNTGINKDNTASKRHAFAYPRPNGRGLIGEGVKNLSFKLESIYKILSDIFKILIVVFAVAGFILSIQIFESNFIVNPAYYLPNHPTKKEMRQIKRINILIHKLKIERYG